MQRSESINEIAGALAKAQGAFNSAERDHVAKVNSKKGEGSSYTFNYADLAAYLEVCREPLSQNGLAFVQSVTTDFDKVTVTTFLTHSSGQWLQSDPFTLIASHEKDQQPTPQSVGSAVTYARRYSLSAILGMASEADDDGNAASGNEATTAKREPMPECPKCGTNKSVIKGKEEFGGGWLCWKKKDGCGQSWKLPSELPEYSEVSPGIHAPPQVNPSGNIMDGPPPKVTTDDARYINEAQASLKAAATEVELRALWETVKDKPGPIKTALHPIYKTRLQELQSA